MSTVTDEIEAKFTTELDLVKYLAIKEVYKGKLQAIDYLMTFPNGWQINDERIAPNAYAESVLRYGEWRMKAIHEANSTDEYHRIIDDKLTELLNDNTVMKGLEPNGNQLVFTPQS